MPSISGLPEIDIMERRSGRPDLRWSAERRDVPIARDVKTPRKRLPRASQARKGCLASTPRLPALRSPFALISGLPEISNHVRRSGKPDLRARGAARDTTARPAPQNKRPAEPCPFVLSLTLQQPPY